MIIDFFNRTNNQLGRKYRFIHMSFKDYNACLFKEDNSELFKYTATLKDGFKAEMIDTLDNIDKAVGANFYKDLIRDEKLNQLGL